jgi:hypothetical protein
MGTLRGWRASHWSSSSQALRKSSWFNSIFYGHVFPCCTRVKTWRLSGFPCTLLLVLVRFCPFFPRMALPPRPMLAWLYNTLQQVYELCKTTVTWYIKLWKQYMYSHNSTFLNTSNCMKGCNCNSFVHQTPQNITLIGNRQKYTTKSPTGATTACSNYIFNSLRHCCN